MDVNFFLSGEHLLLYSFVHFDSLACVVLPVEKHLVVDILGALWVVQLVPERLVLQQIEHVQTHRVLDVLGIVSLLPVLQVLQVVHELALLEKAVLSQVVEVPRVAETLDELELHQEAEILLLCIAYRNCCF